MGRGPAAGLPAGGDPDILLLLRPDGSVAGAFSAAGADPLEIIAAAWEDRE